MAVRRVSPSNAKRPARQAMSQRSFTRELVDVRGSPSRRVSRRPLVSRGYVQRRGAGRSRSVRIVLLLGPGRDDDAETDVHLQMRGGCCRGGPGAAPAARPPAGRAGYFGSGWSWRRKRRRPPGRECRRRSPRRRGARAVPRCPRRESPLPGRPQFRLGPHSEQRRALERESVHLARGGKAIEEPLRGVAVEQEVEVHPPFVRETLQTSAHRGWDVPEFPPSSHASSA